MQVALRSPDFTGYDHAADARSVACATRFADCLSNVSPGFAKPLDVKAHRP